MTMIEPVGMSHVLTAISQIPAATADTGIELLSGDGSFADALVAAATGGGQTSATGTSSTSAPLTGQPALDSTAEVSPSTLLGISNQPAVVPGLQEFLSAPLPGAPAGTSATPTLPAATGGHAATALPTPHDLSSAFAEATAEYGLPTGLLEAVATQESGMNPNAVSSAGAEGIMQIMPATAASNGIRDPFDPTEAIFGAAKILAGNLAAFHSVPLALAAYNAGAGAVEEYGGIPPYSQTQNYVASIMAMMGGPS